MSNEKPIKDMTDDELSEAEPILFPKAVERLTDKELSDKVDVVLKYSSRYLPDGLHSADCELLAELKRRFDVTVASRSTDDEQLLAEFDEVLIESYPDHTLEVLGKVRDRLFDLTVVAEVTQKDLAKRLSSMLSYPDNLSGSDQATLEELLAFIAPPAKSL